MEHDGVVEICELRSGIGKVEPSVTAPEGPLTLNVPFRAECF